MEELSALRPAPPALEAILSAGKNPISGLYEAQVVFRNNSSKPLYVVYDQTVSPLGDISANLFQFNPPASYMGPIGESLPWVAEDLIALLPGETYTSGLIVLDDYYHPLTDDTVVAYRSVMPIHGLGSEPELVESVYLPLGEPDVENVCPVCGTPDAKPIMYGLLPVDAIDDNMSVGGCVIEYGAPNWVCRNPLCNHKF